MKIEKAANLAISCTLVLCMMFIEFGSSNLDQDRAECADQLVVLSPCLPYASGNAKTPGLDCCTVVKPVFKKSEKCLCILIKDRDDPNLGIKINAKRALSLQTACHLSSTETFRKCIGLLHLAPNSKEAKDFQALDRSANTTKTPVPSGSSSNNSVSTAKDEKSDGGMGKMWKSTELMSGILLLIFSSHIIFYNLE